MKDKIEELLLEYGIDLTLISKLKYDGFVDELLKLIEIEGGNSNKIDRVPAHIGEIEDIVDAIYNYGKHNTGRKKLVDYIEDILKLFEEEMRFPTSKELKEAWDKQWDEVTIMTPERIKEVIEGLETLLPEGDKPIEK
jgi:hypothetical protein